MISVALGILLCSATLLLRSFFSSARPANLSARISIGGYSAADRHVVAELISGTKTKVAELFTSQKSLQQVLYELPDFLELLSVAISSGETIYSSLHRVAPRLNGVLANELSLMMQSLSLGADLPGELEALSERLPQRQLIEFSNKLSMALKRGTPLAKVLNEQAESVRQEVLNQLTKQAGKNETRMLVPLVFLILPVTVLFAIYPSLRLLNLSFL